MKKCVEAHCINPTFILDIPEMIGPICKGHPTKPGLTERAELHIVRTEVIDANTDLNDPVEIRKRFKQQSEEKAMGNEEVCYSLLRLCSIVKPLYFSPEELMADKVVVIIAASSRKRVVAQQMQKPTYHHLL